VAWITAATRDGRKPLSVRRRCQTLDRESQ
jgi:hypothetical protein